MFGNSSESRTREAAGRRDLARSRAQEMRGRKRVLIEIRENRDEERTKVS
jgi:hypothetical protein